MESGASGGDSAFYTRLGIELDGLGRRSLAKSAYLTALELDGDLAAAADNFRASMAVEPSSAAHFNLALVLLAQGRGNPRVSNTPWA